MKALLAPKRRRTLGGVAGAAAAAYLVVYQLLPHLLHPASTASGHWETPLPSVALGLIVGATYGLLGVGLVLIYRTNRIINFAHGEIGAFGASMFGLMVVQGHVPYWVALVPALLISALVGALAETAVIRRLRKAPLVMSVVATLGVGQFLYLFGTLLNSKAGANRLYPQPPGLPHFHIGALLVTPSYFAMLVFSPCVVLAIGAFLRYGRYGVAMRCASANQEAARMAGIFAGRMSSLAWGIGGAVAALTAILTAPTKGFSAGDSFGPSLLEIALTAAVLGRMQSMPKALAGGLGIGVIEQLIIWNYPRSSVVSVVLFVLIVGALLLQRQRTGRAEEKGSWASVQALTPLPAELQRLWAVRNLGRVFGLVVLALLALLPVVLSNSDAVKLTGIFAFVIVGLSAGVITGLAGQLSLGQFGIAAIGAVASYQVVSRTGSFTLSFVYAGVAAAGVSVVIGLPALRIKGLLLTVTTLSFALVVPSWLLGQSWALGHGVDPGRPTVFGHLLTAGKQYYWFGLAILLVAMLVARNVRSGGLGRLLVAVRDNEDNARAFTVPASAVKLQGFAIAGFLAGIGGAMYGHSLALVSATSFPTQVSISVIVMTVIGGLGILSGPMLGALVVFVLPTFVNLGTIALAGTSLGELLIIMYLPGGMAAFVTPLRDRVVKAIGRRAGIDVEAAFLAESSSGGAAEAPAASTTAPILVAARKRPKRAHSQLLAAHSLVKSFGGVRAVRGVSFEVNRGETLGLIGPNGAGKTTTFELLAGFTRVDTGQVRLHGKNITHLSPEARGRLGLIRSFQDAALFPTLSVLECVQLSLERRDPTQVGASLLGLGRQERRKEARARELVSWMGLDRYRSAQIQSLSTGTRRITEIACLVGLEPEILLLDEPCAGVAQKETEALALLLDKLKVELDLTLCIIEHDIPMIMSLANRIICMADGEIIAQGTPEIVRTDPRVVESYLGGSITAIERSGLVKPPTRPKSRKRPTTPALLGSI